MNTRRVFITAATSFAAVLMLVVLIYASGIEFDLFVNRLAGLGPWQLLLCFIGFASPVLIASVKWRGVVVRTMQHSATLPSFPFFFHISALSGVVGQVITPYAAGPFVRGFATRQMKGGSFAFGASTSVLEQVFDAWASLVFSGAGLLFLLAGISPFIALFGFAVAAAIGIIGIYFLLALPSSTPVLTWLERRFPRQRERIGALIALKERSGIASLGFIGWLYWLSVLRFWVPCFAIVAVAGTFAEDWTVLGLIQVYAAAEITRFAVFTPGNLGLAEWGWTTVLALFGWSFQSAALFALTFRIVGIAFTSLVYVLSAALYLLPGLMSGAGGRQAP